MNPFKLFSRKPEEKAAVSPLRTVNPTTRRQPPPVSVLEETRPDDVIIPLVGPSHMELVEAPNIYSARALRERRRANNDAAMAELEDKVIGVACCRHCDAELEVRCPNGHGGADEVLRDLTLSKAVPEVAQIIERAPKVKQPLKCACGKIVARNPKGGRDPRNPLCVECKAKKEMAA